MSWKVLSLAAGSGCERLSLQGLGSFRRFVPRFVVGVDCGNASHAQFKLTANVPGPGLSSIGRPERPNYLSDWLLKDVKRQVRFVLNMSEPSRASCVARPGVNLDWTSHDVMLHNWHPIRLHPPDTAGKFVHFGGVQPRGAGLDGVESGEHPEKPRQGWRTLFSILWHSRTSPSFSRLRVLAVNVKVYYVAVLPFYIRWHNMSSSIAHAQICQWLLGR